jgi:hypothetical protein
MGNLGFGIHSIQEATHSFLRASEKRVEIGENRENREREREESEGWGGASFAPLSCVRWAGLDGKE